MEEKIIEARKIFGRRAQRLRLDAGLDKKALSKKLGLSDTVISIYEDGKANPSLESLLRYSFGFDVSIDWLIGRTDLRRIPTKEHLKEIKTISNILGNYVGILQEDLSMRDGE